MKIISILFFCYSLSFAQSQLFNSPQEVKKFADYLYCEFDYLRAAEEYQKFLRTDKNDTVIFKSVLSYYMMDRFSDVLNFSVSSSRNFVFYDDTQFLKLISLFRLNMFNEFDTTAALIKMIGSKLETNSEKLIRFTFLMRDSISSKGFIVSPFDETEKTTIEKFYDRKQNPHYKSPLLAAVFSSIIPGSGKVYADKLGDGIFAFLTTGVFTFLAYDNFKADHKFRGWLFGGLAGLFYAGNIYGSAAAAQIFNAGVQFNFQNDIQIYLTKKKHYLPEYDFCN
ncbi:MAG: hypothetical protein AUK34_10350 [Ignavibacteria bacterium CG2_30_36_16]|nr:hypothetical protein [Ignavibacteria bacterium]OIP57021.1 MAG: hypothetical protein AUK34_10350 [Ignavibacteria bacterium CG2_30_36_16]